MKIKVVVSIFIFITYGFLNCHDDFLYCNGVMPVCLLKNLQKKDGFAKFKWSDISVIDKSFCFMQTLASNKTA